MKPNYTAQRKAITVAWRKWELLLDIVPFWTVTHLWNEGSSDDSEAAACNAQWEYRQAALRWNLPVLALYSDDEVERFVVHEACHILLAPMESKLPDAYAELGEFTVESLSRVLLKRGG